MWKKAINSMWMFHGDRTLFSPRHALISERPHIPCHVAHINLWIFLFLVENCACFCPRFQSSTWIDKNIFFMLFEVMCEYGNVVESMWISTPLDIIKFNSITLDFEQKHSGDDGDVSIYNFISPFWSAFHVVAMPSAGTWTVFQLKFSISANFHWNAYLSSKFT